jgi:hypothetical protein
VTEDGKLCVGERLTRIEQHIEAQDRDHGLTTGRLWKEIDEMKQCCHANMQAIGKEVNNLEIKVAVSTTRLAVIIAILCFVASIAAQVGMDALKQPKDQANVQVTTAKP